MKKKWMLASSILLLVLGACSNEQVAPVADFSQQWSELTEAAQGTTVNLYMWGGSDSINSYFDEWVTPRLEEQYDISLNRVPVNDTQEILTQLLDEKTAGKESGSIDIMWINGENFRNAKDNDLLNQPFADKLPNVAELVDQQAPQIAEDFGIPVDNLQAPWGTAQFVMTYNSEDVINVPTSFEQLAQWVQDNPGQFTYPALPDFTGGAFVRHALEEIVGTDQFTSDEPLERDEFDTIMEPVWEYLNAIEPYLWRAGDTYPESLARLDQLYTNGEVAYTMAYDPIKAAAEVQNGRFPDSTRTFIFDGGTLSNTHYLAIPFNAENPLGAAVVINELLSVEAQAAKLDPANWGDLPVLDFSKLSDEQQQVFTAIDLGEASLSIEELESKRIAEIPSIYVEWIEEGWLENVAQN